MVSRLLFPFLFRLETDTWIREQTVEKSLQCEEDYEERLCAPINCRYDNITVECTEIDDDLDDEIEQIEVVTTRCPLCFQDKTKEISLDKTEICEDVVKDTCRDDPLPVTWFKYCAQSREVSKIFYKFKVLDHEMQTI